MAESDRIVCKVLDYQDTYHLDDPRSWPYQIFAFKSSGHWAINEFLDHLVLIAEEELDTGEYMFDLTAPEEILMDLIDTYAGSPNFGAAVEVWEDLLEYLKPEEVNTL